MSNVIPIRPSLTERETARALILEQLALLSDVAEWTPREQTQVARDLRMTLGTFLAAEAEERIPGGDARRRLFHHLWSIEAFARDETATLLLSGLFFALAKRYLLGQS